MRPFQRALIILRHASNDPKQHGFGRVHPRLAPFPCPFMSFKPPDISAHQARQKLGHQALPPIRKRFFTEKGTAAETKSQFPDGSRYPSKNESPRLAKEDDDAEPQDGGAPKYFDPDTETLLVRLNSYPDKTMGTKA